MDVVLCLRVFVRYISGKDICGTHDKITEHIRTMTPKDYEFDKNCPMEENSEAIISKGGKSKKRRTKRRRKTKRKTKRRRKTKTKH